MTSDRPAESASRLRLLGLLLAACLVLGLGGSPSHAGQAGPSSAGPLFGPSPSTSAVGTRAAVQESDGIRLVRNGIGLVLLGMSFYLVALVIWMFLEFRRATAIPEALVRDFELRLSQGRPLEAQDRLLGDRSYLGRVLAAGVQRLPRGVPASIRAMELANERVMLEMEARAGYLATVATLGPMIGLLGTVYGMIMSFGVLARAAESPEAGQLAAGISTALISTLEGIAIAVPAIIFAAIFRGRIVRLATEVQQTAENLLDRLGAASPTGPATAAASPRAPAAPATLHPLAAAAIASARQAQAKLP